MKRKDTARSRNLRAVEGDVEAFRALAHLGRLRVFFHLVLARGEVSVGEMQAAIGVPWPTLSHHLDLLRRAGLIRRRRRERFMLYSLEDQRVAHLFRLLRDCCP